MNSTTKEILKLLRENNEMLLFIVQQIIKHNANAEGENVNDFMMNLAANLLSNRVDYKL